MWPYALLLLPAAAFGLAGRLPPRRALAVQLLAAAGLALFLGLRRRIGCDWFSYELMFRRFEQAGLPEALAYSDPFYVLLNLAAAEAGLGIVAVNLAVAAILVAGVAALARATPRPGLALAIAMPVLLVAVGMSANRQAAALGILLWMLARLLNGRERGALVLILLAILFHWTAIVFLPLPALLRLRRPVPLRLLLALGAGAGVALAAAVWLQPFLAAEAARAAPATGALVRSAFTLLALGILVFGERRLGLSERERRLLGYLGATALGAIALAPVGTAITDRIGYYGVPVQMIVFARFVAALPRPRLHTFAALAIALCYFAALAGWLAFGNSRICMVPYRTVLVQPAS